MIEQLIEYNHRPHELARGAVLSTGVVDSMTRQDQDTGHVAVAGRDGPVVAPTTSLGQHFSARVNDPQSGLLSALSPRMTVLPAASASPVPSSRL